MGDLRLLLWPEVTIVAKAGWIGVGCFGLTWRGFCEEFIATDDVFWISVVADAGIGAEGIIYFFLVFLLVPEYS